MDGNGSVASLKYQVINAADFPVWKAALEPFLEADVYFSPEYLRASEMCLHGAEALAFIADKGSDRLFYPFLLRPIPETEGAVDIESAYGYGGPLATTDDLTFLSAAWQAFGAWCRERHVVAEFVRFHAVLGNHRYMDRTCTVSFDRVTVGVPIDVSEEELWRGYSSVQRNRLRRAIASGMSFFKVPLLEGLASFKKLYQQTMKRVGATPFYYFPDPYYVALSSLSPQRLHLFVVRRENILAAAALFFADSGILHYHLGASEPELLAQAPNNFLFHSVADWGRLNGFRLMHLGGGYTNQPDDSLFVFKARFSKLRFPFYIGRRIHDSVQYETLCSQWMSKNSITEQPSYFLLYRLPSVVNNVVHT